MHVFITSKYDIMCSSTVMDMPTFLQQLSICVQLYCAIIIILNYLAEMLAKIRVMSSFVSMDLPRKSSAEKWSASQTWRLSRAGIFVSDSSQENNVSFRDITIFSSATR